MSSRAKRVVLSYLQNRKISQTEMNENTLDDSEIRETISEALENFYPSYINSKLRNLDISELMVASTRMVEHFGDASKAIFQADMSALKNKILNAVGDAATSDKGSLKQRYFNYFRSNPTNDVEEINDFIRKDLIQDSRDTLKEMNKYVTKAL